MCYFRLMRGEPVVFDHLFKGFDHFAQSLVATLVIVGAMLVVMIPAYVAMFAATLASASAASASDDGGAVAGVLLMLFMFVFVVAVVAVSLFAGMISIFAYPLIVDRGLGGIDALKTAMRTVVANFWGLLGLVLLVGLIATVASMLCIIPYFFVIPWIFGAFAITYRRLFPDTSAAA